MAKPDEAVDPLTALQDLLREGKKRPLNFALLKTKEGVVIKTDPKKSSEVMFRKAKEEGGMPAVSCQGTLTVEGKMIIMQALTDDVPRNLPKLTKRHFQNLGFKAKVQVRLPGGGTLDDEDEDEDKEEKNYNEVSSGLMAPEEEAPPVDKAALEARLNAVMERIVKAAGAPVALLDDLNARLQEARTMLADGREADVPAWINRIETDLKQIEDEQLALKTKLETDFAALAADLESIRTRGAPPVAKKADSIAAVFTAEIGRDLKKAQSALTLLSGFLKVEVAKLPPAPADGGGGSAPGAKIGPDGGVPAGAPAGDATQEAPQSADACFAQIGATFGAFWDHICAVGRERSEAAQAEQAAIMAQRQKIVDMFKGGIPAGPQLAALLAEVAKLTNLVGTAQKIAKIEETQPETAMKMREAMTGFDAELGAGTEVTDEVLTQIKADNTAAQAAHEAAVTALTTAQGMPAGPERDAAVAAAQADVTAKNDAWLATYKKLTAAKGKKGLTTAMTTGPLAPDAARPLADGDAAKFVEAFPRQPELAEFGLETASTSQNPGAVASGMGMLCDKMDSGFAADDGRQPAPGFNDRAYAKNLIRGAGAEGGDYMAKAGEYIGGGGHLQANPIPNPNGNSPNGLERDRSNYLASAVIGPDGKINPESPQAQGALGHLRFNPDVISDPTPSLNNQAIKTYGMLSNPDNLTRAQGILDGVGTPTGTGQALLGRGMGKAPGTVTDADADQQIMAAMMTPVHQGPVGSCFSTAGVRRMNETDPLESMGRYAELASTGTFRPRNGEDPIPAIMNFPADENALIRSMEYSAATVMAGMDNNWVNTSIQTSNNAAVDGLTGAVGNHPEFFSRLGTDNWEVDKKLIEATLAASFRVEYDATRETAPSPDGSSSKGVYILIQTAPTRVVIDSQAAYVTALTERVLTAIGEPADSKKGKEIAKVIASEDFLKSLMQGETAPWSLGGGNFQEEADDVLFGSGHSNVEMTSDRSTWDNIIGTTEGERSEELLEKMLKQSEGSSAQMIPISNNGIHAFNMLPNDPSMAKLREGGDIEGNIERTLVKPGKDIAKTPLTQDKAGEIAREMQKEMLSWDNDAGRRPLLEAALRGPFRNLTPKQMKDQVVPATVPWTDAVAQVRTNDWVADETAKGAPPTPAAIAAELAKWKSQYAKWAEGAFMGASAKEIPMPKVTFADSNWGDATRDVRFVMAPNPVTGELVMWEQEIPSGAMSLSGADWVDAGWQRVTP